MKAKAAVLTKPGEPFELREYELAAPATGYALVEMLASGICGTDAHIYNGRLAMPVYPIVIGHEFIGRISEISLEGSQKYGFYKGDNVIVNVAIPCGKCCLCESGESANCLNLTASYFHDPDAAPHLYGGFSEYVYASMKNMIKIPKTLPTGTAAVFACAGPTVVNTFRSIKHIGFDKIKNAVVQGSGPVGLFAIMYLKANGIRNIISVTRSYKESREKLARAMGANSFVYTSQMSPEERLDTVLKACGGIGADCVVEASGNPEAFTEGMNFLRNKGIYLVPGQYSNSGGVKIEPQIITFKALQIIGASQYTLEDQQDYLSFLEANPHTWKAIDAACTHQWKLCDVNEAMETVLSGKSVKSIFIGEKGENHHE